jgi:hypothetical protein
LPPKNLSDEERDRLRKEFEAMTTSSKTYEIEYNGRDLKVVRVGMNHKEAWPIIESIIKSGYHIAGITGNGTGMNQGFVLLERNQE